MQTIIDGVVEGGGLLVHRFCGCVAVIVIGEAGAVIIQQLVVEVIFPAGVVGGAEPVAGTIIGILLIFLGVRAAIRRLASS